MQRWLIADDHALLREALAGAVRMGWPDAAIMEAASFPEAWSRAADAPHVIIADLVMPGAAPKAGIAGLLAAAPDARILIVTGTQDDALLVELLDMGVAGFAPKTSNGAIIEAALRLIIAGGRYLPPRVAEIAAARVSGEHDFPFSGIKAAERLTDRQLDVLRLVALGRSNKEIGRALNLAPSTVKTHLSQIFYVLGAANRTEASIKARGLDLV